MIKRTSPVLIVVVALAALLLISLGAVASADQPTQTSVLRATQETSHYKFYARSRRVETECEPTTAKALRMGGHRVGIPALFSNRAANGSVYVYERQHSTCVSLVNWTKHRVIVHFTLVLLDTTTRLG